MSMMYLKNATLCCQTRLVSGGISELHFNKLKRISAIHSQKVLDALEDYCVHGNDRKSACEKFNVSQGYFSICLRKMQRLHADIIDIMPHYIR